MSLDSCFSKDVVNPVELLSAGPARQVSTLEELDDYLCGPHGGDGGCLAISICQRTSWSPLQITKSMLERIVSRCEISPSFWEIPSCFYTRNVDIEEVFCVPYTQSISDTCIEISYTIRYPELKEGGSWVIRQTGIHHRLDKKDKQSVYVIFSPTPNSKAHLKIRDFLSQTSKDDITNDPFWAHCLLFSEYLPAWRKYIASHEREVLKIRNKTIAEYIDKKLSVGYDSLSALVSTENHFLQIPAILAHTAEVLDELVFLADQQRSGPFLSTKAKESFVSRLKHHRRRCTNYSRTASYLLQRTQTTAQLLAETLSFRDQVIAKEQNGTMLRLNKSVVFITTVTLLYLPASFVSSFFGMSFFNLDEKNNRLIISPMIWIYVVSTAMLTAATFLFYFWLLLHEKRPPHTPKSRFRRVLGRLWTGDALDQERQMGVTGQRDVELQEPRRGGVASWSVIGSG